MPIIDNCDFQFMYNNQFDLTYNSLTIDSEKSGFPFTNSSNTDLFKEWKIESHFKIDATNNKIYVDALTATLTVANYTGATLATEIQTQLNAVSSNWTVTYSTTTHRFTLDHTGIVTLILSNQTNAAWFTLGYTSIVDIPDTNFVANEQRNHYPSVQITIDVGYNANIGFLGIFSKLGTPFSISENATVTIEGDNLNFLGTIALTKTATITQNGAFSVINDVESEYRYWRITIEDIFNLNGPEIGIGYLYLGYASQANERNVSSGFDHGLVDNSTVSIAENGSLYFDSKTKTNQFGSINIPLAKETTRDVIEDLYKTVGKTTPFVIAIDPKTAISSTVDKFTKLVRFASDPVFNHVHYNLFNISFTLEEVI